MSDEEKKHGYNEEQTIGSVSVDYKQNVIGGHQQAVGIGGEIEYQNGDSSTIKGTAEVTVGKLDVSSANIDDGARLTTGFGVGAEYGRALTDNFKVTVGAQVRRTAYDQESLIPYHDIVTDENQPADMSMEERREYNMWADNENMHIEALNAPIEAHNEARAFTAGGIFAGLEVTSNNQNYTAGAQVGSVWSKAGNSPTQQVFTGSIYGDATVATFKNGTRLAVTGKYEQPFSKTMPPSFSVGAKFKF